MSNGFGKKNWREYGMEDWKQGWEDSLSGGDYWDKTIGRAQKSIAPVSQLYKFYSGLDKMSQTKAINTGLVSDYPEHFQYSSPKEYGFGEGGMIREFLEGSMRTPGQRIGLKPGVGHKEIGELPDDSRIDKWFQSGEETSKLQDFFGKKLFSGDGVSGLSLGQMLGTASGAYRGLTAKKPSDMIHGALQAFGAAGAFGGFGIPILAINYLWDMFD